MENQQAANVVEKALLELIKPAPAFTSLSVEYNRHHAYYQSACEWWAGEEKDYLDDPEHLQQRWRSAEDFNLAMKTDSVWELQYYPRTPVSFVVIYASSLAKLLEWAAADE